MAGGGARQDAEVADALKDSPPRGEQQEKAPKKTKQERKGKSSQGQGGQEEAAQEQVSAGATAAAARAGGGRGQPACEQLKGGVGVSECAKFITINASGTVLTSVSGEDTIFHRHVVTQAGAVARRGAADAGEQHIFVHQQGHADAGGVSRGGQRLCARVPDVALGGRRGGPRARLFAGRQAGA